MVSKIVDIEETVEAIKKGVRSTRIPDGLSEENLELAKTQQRLDRVHGEIARFLMEEQNRGTSLRSIYRALLAALGVAVVNMMKEKSASAVIEMTRAQQLTFPDDIEHSAIHAVTDNVGDMLHAHLFSRRHNGEVRGDFGVIESHHVDFKRKEVGDA